jgi:hypothetical protein
MFNWLKNLTLNEGKLFINELDFQLFSTVHSAVMQKPMTIASANTIAPVSFLTILTGNTVIKTITPPLTTVHMIALQFAGNAGSDATGNITAAFTSVNGQIGLYVFNPISNKYTAVT